MTRSRNYIATPPGATIKEQLSDRGMSQKEFAARMDMSEKHISRLINGDVQLTSEVAIRLEMVLGVPAKFWNNLEAIYREKLNKVEMENTMQEDEILAKQFPYSEMARYGWVPPTKILKEKVINLRKFFGVVKLSLLEKTQITKIAYRRLSVTKKGDLALLAWVQEVKIESRNISTAPINVKGVIDSIPEIRKMTLQTPDEFCPRLEKMLAENGVALAFLPHLTGTFLHGATFLDGTRFVVGLTTRGKDADRFWFSFFHELAHIILGHVGKMDGITGQDEKDADNWARDNLIPEAQFNEFKRCANYTSSSVVSFARNVGVTPGIVVGRLQNEGIIKHNMLNGLKEKYVISDRYFKCK